MKFHHVRHNEYLKVFVFLEGSFLAVYLRIGSSGVRSCNLCSSGPSFGNKMLDFIYCCLICADVGSLGSRLLQLYIMFVASVPF